MPLEITEFSNTYQLLCKIRIDVRTVLRFRNDCHYLRIRCSRKLHKLICLICRNRTGHCLGSRRIPLEQCKLNQPAKCSNVKFCAFLQIDAINLLQPVEVLVFSQQLVRFVGCIDFCTHLHCRNCSYYRCSR